MTDNSPADEPTYVMADTDYATELSRLRRLEGIRDADSAHYIDMIGVGRGWRCVDIGAGAGSVARHLAQLTGSSGLVVAADMNTRFLADFDGPGRQVLTHDITTGPVPPADFDFAHCRAVLTHVRDPGAAIKNMAASVRAEGWVLCEEPDYVSMKPCDPDHPHAADLETFRAIMTKNGRQDGYVGRKILNLFKRAGLKSVRSEGRTAVVEGGSPAAQFRIHGIESTRHRLLESGFFDDEAIDRLIAMFRDPSFAYLDLTWIATWGRSPG